METLPLCFRILDETVAVETERLAVDVRLDEILPALRSLDDAAVSIAARKNGRPVTCAEGCSACCRIQLVPVTPAEAYALLRLVETLPESEKTRVRGRFASSMARLESSGMADFFREADAVSDSPAMRTNLAGYLELGIECPFLEGGRCGIYAVRPFACREYLVTSPKELCRRPLSEPVETVPLILPVARAAMETGAGVSGCAQRMIPLIFALEFAEKHRQELETLHPSGVLLAQSLKRAFLAAHEQGSLGRQPDALKL